MKSLNQINLIGHCGADPVVRSTGGTQLAEFSIATNAKWSTGERTDWHRVVAWGKLSDIVAQYLRKGERVFVSGSVQYSKYTDKNGVERESTKIVARDVLLLGSKSGSSGGPAPDAGGDDDFPF